MRGKHGPAAPHGSGSSLKGFRGSKRREENNHAESFQRIRDEGQRGGLGRRFHHRRRVWKNRHVAGGGYHHAADRLDTWKSGFFRFVRESFWKIIRHTGGS